MKEEKIKKLKILGIGNENEFNYLIIKKEKNFFELIEEWIYKSFPGEYFSDISKYSDEKNNYEPKKKNIKDYEEVHENYGKEGIRFDAFFSETKIFLTIYTSLENRKKLMDNLEEYCEFFEYEGEKTK